MKKKYAIYCSGSASRVIKYFEKYNKSKYQIQFLFYDGGNESIINRLKQLFPNKVLVYQFDDNLSKKESSNKLSIDLLDKLVQFEVDYLFCFGTRILKGTLLSKYENRIINFHPSLLPSFPGLNAIDQALSSGVQILGNTAHFIDSGIDTGPIIMQTVIRRSNFREYDDVLDLQVPMLKKIWEMLEIDNIKLVNGQVILLGQDNSDNNSYFSTL